MASPTDSSSSPSELEYLKKLVSQLNEKIETLETQTSKGVSSLTQKASDALQSAKVAIAGPSTPVEGKRLILIGPPGAGKFLFSLVTSLFFSAKSTEMKSC